MSGWCLNNVYMMSDVNAVVHVWSFWVFWLISKWLWVIITCCSISMVLSYATSMFDTYIVHAFSLSMHFQGTRAWSMIWWYGMIWWKWQKINVSYLMYNLGNLLSMDAGFRECCKNTKRPRIPHLSPIFQYSARNETRDGCISQAWWFTGTT